MSQFDFGEVICSYSRADAHDEGVLIQLSPQLTKEIGIKFPVSVTRAVHERCIEVTPCAEKMCNDLSGRTWDVLWMLSQAMRKARGSELTFEVYAIYKRNSASLHKLKAVCGPGDNGEPVLTVMLPNED